MSSTVCQYIHLSLMNRTFLLCQPVNYKWCDVTLVLKFHFVFHDLRTFLFVFPTNSASDFAINLSICIKFGSSSFFLESEVFVEQLILRLPKLSLSSVGFFLWFFCHFHSTFLQYPLWCEEQLHKWMLVCDSLIPRVCQISLLLSSSFYTQMQQLHTVYIVTYMASYTVFANIIVESRILFRPSWRRGAGGCLPPPPPPQKNKKFWQCSFFSKSCLNVPFLKI